MNTTLKYNSMTRIESDEQIIASLLRKGWYIESPPIVAPQTPAPDFDPETERMVYDQSTNSWEVIPLSTEQLLSISEHKAIRERQKIKSEKLANFNNKVSEGFSISPENIVLALGESDRNTFSQMLGLVKEALELEFIDGETLQTISDKNGQKHQLTTTRFRQVMVAYGFYFKTLWDGLNP